MATLSVLITTISGKVLSIPITKETTTDEVKKLLGAETDANPSLFDIEFEGNTMNCDDDKPIIARGLVEGSELQMIRSRKAIAKEALAKHGIEEPTVEGLLEHIHEDGSLCWAFIESGSVDINTIVNGKSFLGEACSIGDIDVAKQFLDLGIDINFPDKASFTPLHDALWNDYNELSELLIERGADVDARNRDDATPFHFVKQVSTIKLLLDHKSDCNVQDKSGETPLHHLCSKKDTQEAAVFLIESGADVSIRTESNETPLHLAVSLSVVSSLLSHGCDVDAQDSNGDTFLHRLADSTLRGLNWSGREEEHLQIIRLVIQHKANVNIQNNRGDTPLTKLQFQSRMWSW